MVRFDVCTCHGASTPFVLNVQADLFEIDTYVVVPLMLSDMAGHETVPKLKPILEIEGHDYVMLTTEIGTVSKTQIDNIVCNIENDYRHTITEALDFLFQGF